MGYQVRPRLPSSSRQTVYHQPEPVVLFGQCVTSTLQLGDPSVIAHQCKVQTVGDFRVADMAVGGQGAPLVPYLDVILSRRHLLQSKQIAVLVNIGGISNISACSPHGQCWIIVALPYFLHNACFPVDRPGGDGLRLWSRCLHVSCNHVDFQSPTPLFSCCRQCSH